MQSVGKTSRTEQRRVDVFSRVGEYMRTASFLALLMLTSITLTGFAIATPPTQGDSITINDFVSWTDGNFDGEIIIADGGELDWSGDISIAQDSTILIEEGGTLHLDSANIQTGNSASTLLIYDGTEIELDENIEDTTSTMTVYFNIDVPESAYLNLSIDGTANSITGTSASFTVDLTQTVDILVTHYYPFQLGITRIELFHSNAELRTINAEELSQQGGNVIWDQASFTIENHGTVHVHQSTIISAELICEGSCSIQESNLYGSGPINVANGSHIDVIDSMLLGSRTDEDIILHDQATIQYTNSTGTGGYTDAWIRLLSMREIIVNAPIATVTATGIGYGGETINTIINGEYDDPSTWIVDLGTTEQKRIVEWLDGNGVYGQESATIKVTVESNWGNFVADATAPQTSSANVNVVYPQLVIDKVEPEAVTADTGRTHGVMVTISNTGTIAVNPNVRCYVDDTEADTTANTANWGVEPGETKDVPITWYHYSDEAVQLTCKFLYPDVLEPLSNLIANDAGTTSGEVSWTTAEEVEELPIVLYGTIVLMVVIFAGVIAVRAQKGDSKEYIVQGANEFEESPEEDDSHEAESDNLESDVGDESEDQDNQEEWLDADGNPIIG